MITARLVAAFFLATLAASASAQAPSATAPGIGLPRSMGGAPPAVPDVPLSPEARDILKMLEARRDTLKDFTGKIDYSVFHPDLGDNTGKRGTVDFLVDPNKGPNFTVDFTADTEDGKPRRAHHQQVIFDGQNVTTKDFPVKQFIRINVVPPGGKPGDATTLNGPMPLPVGIKVDEVEQNFNVTVLPGTTGGPDHVTLRLAPKVASKFDFRQLEVTIDKKLQIPVKLVQTARNRDVTTITLTDIQLNTGKARMQDPNPPAGEGWTERKADQGNQR